MRYLSPTSDNGGPVSQVNSEAQDRLCDELVAKCESDHEAEAGEGRGGRFDPARFIARADALAKKFGPLAHVLPIGAWALLVDGLVAVLKEEDARLNPTS